MNTDSINFGTSITEISVIAQHSALGMRFYKFDLKDKEEAKPILAQLMRPDSAVLLKASRGMKMEELTAYLRSITMDP